MGSALSRCVVLYHHCRPAPTQGFCSVPMHALPFGFPSVCEGGVIGWYRIGCMHRLNCGIRTRSVQEEEPSLGAHRPVSGSTVSVLQHTKPAPWLVGCAGGERAEAASCPCTTLPPPPTGSFKREKCRVRCMWSELR